MMELANALLIVLAMVAPLVVVNAQTTVDWTSGKDYSSYSTQSFKPGGTILFNYDSSLHDVLIVSKSDYENCVTRNALQTFKDGKTLITLKEGTMYFICGKPGHCAPGGMKLQVTVGDTSSSSSATPTTPTTPATPTTPTTPATPTTPTTSTPTDSSSTTPPAPSPKNSNGAASLSSQFVFGVAFVLGTLFAITG